MNLRTLHLISVTLTCLAFAACERAAQDPAAGDAPDAPRGPVEHELSAETMARNRVTTAPAERRVLRERFLAPARVAFDADATVHVGSTLTGRIVELPARVGMQVQAGDVLMVVESPELGTLQGELLLQRQTAAASAPLVALAKDAWERASSLHEESQGIALVEVRRREAEYRSALAGVQLAEAAALAAAQRLQVLGMGAGAVEQLVKGGAIQPRHAVRAPAAGTIVERSVVLGDLVDPEHGTLCTIVDTTRAWVLADVPEARVADVAPGTEATVHVMHVDGAQVVGKVAHVAPALDLATHTARVRIVVEQPPAFLRAGMFCEARMQVADGRPGAQQEVLAVPEVAVQSVDGKPVVFVPVPGAASRFHMRQVEVGAAVDGFVPVRAGLAAGESVVTEGSFLLKAHVTQSTGSSEG